MDPGPPHTKTLIRNIGLVLLDTEEIKEGTGTTLKNIKMSIKVKVRQPRILFMAGSSEAQEQIEEENLVPKIINLSSTDLSDTQKSVLGKGFKYTPTPKYSEQTMRSDIQQFGRKLRLQEHFHDVCTDDDSLVRNKSTYTPDKGKDGHLDLYVEFLNNAPIGKRFTNTKEVI